MTEWRTPHSRRRAIRMIAATPLVLAGLGPAASKAQRKKPFAKADVNYQDSPKGERSCSGCRRFLAEQKACKIVAGTIRPTGWCTMWVAK